MAEDYLEEFELNKVRQNPSFTPQVRQTMMADVKKSFFSGKKLSSWTTIINLSNNMIGSSILIFPLIFNEFGIVNAVCMLVVIMLISCKTCLLQIKHVKCNELDLPDTIKRILGRKWWVGYAWASFLFNFFIGVIYFLIMTHCFHSILDFSLQSYPFIRQQFLFYLPFTLGAIVFLLLAIDDLRILLIICKYGFIAIIIYVFYMVYLGTDRLIEKKFIFEKLKLYSWDISTLAGVFSLAFFVHNTAVTIVKSNLQQGKSSFNIFLSFLLTAGIYIVIGIFGMIAIPAEESEWENKNPQTVLDFFKSSWILIFVNFAIFIQLFSVLPFLWYVGRSQFLEVFYEDVPFPSLIFYLSNFLFCVFCIGIYLTQIKLTTLISLNGAITGYFMIYIIPINLHLTCLYHKTSSLGENLIKNIDFDFLDKEINSELVRRKEDNLIDNVRLSKLSLEVEDLQCASSHMTFLSRKKRKVNYVVYGIIATFGSLMAVNEIMKIFF